MTVKDKKRLKLVATRLTALREQKGLSIRELASRCDIDHSRIAKFERNEVNLNITTLIEIAEGLDISPKEFFEY